MYIPRINYCWPNPYTSALFVKYTNRSYRLPQKIYWLSNLCTNQEMTPFGIIPGLCYSQELRPRETALYTFPGDGDGYILTQLTPMDDAFSLLPVKGGNRYSSANFHSETMKPLQSLLRQHWL